MSATILYFRSILPAFTEEAVSDETVTAYLSIALAQMVEGMGDNADAGQSFLAAHIMSIAGIGPTSQSGELAGFTNLKVGSLSLTRAEKVAMGEYYSSSPYGQLYWMLARRGIGPAITVTPTGCIPEGYWPGWPGQR